MVRSSEAGKVWFLKSSRSCEFGVLVAVSMPLLLPPPPFYSLSYSIKVQGPLWAIWILSVGSNLAKSQREGGQGVCAPFP